MWRPLVARAPGCALAGLACVLWSRAALADRVLPETAGPPVFAALAGLGPAFQLVSARIERDRVWASVCRAEDQTRCFEVELADPRRGCAATTAGPWCVTFTGAVPDATRDALLAALREHREEAIWKDLAPDPPAEPVSPAAGASPPRALPPAGGSPSPRLAALALLLGPILLGAAAGRTLARLGRARWPARAIAGLVPPIAAIALLPALLWIGAWDAIAAGIGLGLGLLLGTSPAPARAARVAAIAAIAMLVALEIGARFLPPAPATFAPAEEARLFLASSPGEGACSPIFPAQLPAAFQVRTARVRAGAPLVLHVGDSMVEGVGVAPEQAFPALLGEMQPAIDHVNAGFASSSIDFELLVIRAWLDRLRASRVILYVFGYNDLAELDRTYPCCPGGPLLDATADAHGRCAVPGIATGRRELLGNSPAPYVLRVAAPASALARHGVVAFARAGEALQRSRGGDASDPDRRWSRFATVMGALAREVRGRGVELGVVYLPARASMESPSPKKTGDYALRGRIADLCRSLDVPVMDPWDEIESAVHRDGAARYYLPPPDIHFTPEGHRLMAEWLAPKIATGHE